MSRHVVRRRVLGAVLGLAAVVGATAGVVVAASPDDPGDTRRSDPSGEPNDLDDRDQVLWADQDALHDGDVTVPLGLVDPPTAVRRIAGGWLVVVEIARDLGEYQVSVVRPDQRPAFLAETTGIGDVSDDGARYLAGTESGYSVWDLASGDVVDTVRAGREPSQQAAGSAQFVDDDTVATSWAPELDALAEVLVSDLDPDERTVLADDVLDGWGVSPDGRWFVGSLAVPDDGGSWTAGCTVVRAVGGGTADSEDCGGTIDGGVSFAADSSAVLTDPGGPTSDGPGGYRLLPLGGADDRGVVSAPAGSVRAAVVGDDRVAVVPSRAYDPSAVVLLCSTTAPCEEVGRSQRSPNDIALGP